MGFIADIFTADQDRRAQTNAANQAAEVSQRTTDQQLELQRSMFNTLWAGTEVQRAYGDAATRTMGQLLGLTIPSSSQTNPNAPNTPNTPNLPNTPTNPAGTQSGGSTSPLPPQPSGPTLPAMAPASAYEDPGAGNALDRYKVYEAQAGAVNALGGPQVQPMMQTGGPQVQPLATGTPAATTTAPTTPAPASPGNALNPTDWLRSTPGYQFNLDEGMRALNTGLAGQGRLQSGDASREAIRYGQNYGDRIYTDQFNRLAGIAGTGQVAQSQGQQAGTNYVNAGTNVLGVNANNQMGSSYARGNAQSGFWGAVGGSINNAENMAMRFMGGF